MCVACLSVVMNDGNVCGEELKVIKLAPLLVVVIYLQLHRAKDPEAAARVPAHRLGVHRSESNQLPQQAEL